MVLPGTGTMMQRARQQAAQAVGTADKTVDVGFDQLHAQFSEHSKRAAAAAKALELQRSTFIAVTSAMSNLRVEAGACFPSPQSEGIVYFGQGTSGALLLPACTACAPRPAACADSR